VTSLTLSWADLFNPTFHFDYLFWVRGREGQILGGKEGGANLPNLPSVTSKPEVVERLIFMFVQ